jgi:erythromycin esterase
MGMGNVVRWTGVGVLTASRSFLAAMVLLSACVSGNGTVAHKAPIVTQRAASPSEPASPLPLPAVASYPWENALQDPALNLSFEKVTAGTRSPELWYVFPEDTVSADAQASHTGTYSLHLLGSAGSNAFGAQRASGETLAGARLTFRGFVRRSDSSKTALALWVRIEGEDGDVLRVAEASPPEGAPAGDWIEVRVSVEVPAGARWVHFGPRLKGEGEGWVDDLELSAELIRAPTVVTASVRVVAPDGRPLEGAWVTALRRGVEVASVLRSDAAGVARFQLPAGDYSFSAHHTVGQAVYTRPAAVQGDHEISLQLSSDPGTSIDVRAAGIDHSEGLTADSYLVLRRYSDDEGDAFAIPLQEVAELKGQFPPSDRGFIVAIESPTLADSTERLGKSGGSAILKSKPMRAPTSAVIDWVATHHVTVAGSDPTLPTDDLAPLLPALRHARLIGVGEATHGTHEFFQMKHRLLKLLVARGGVRLFILEDEDTLCRAVDAYVQGGPGDVHEIMSNLFPIFESEEMRALIEWVRDWNAHHAEKVHFVGIDLQDIIAVESNLRGFLTRAGESDPEHWLSPLHLVMSRYPSARPDILDPSLRSATQTALDDLVALFKKRSGRWAKKLGVDAVASARHDLRLVEQAFRMSQTRAGLVEDSIGGRDAAMAENAMWHLDHEGHGARAMLWAHNSHVAFDALGGSKMMGWHLRHALGDRYIAVGQEWSQGGYQAVDNASVPFTRGMREYVIGPPRSSSLSAAFARSPGIAIVDLRSLPAGEVRDWFSTPHTVREVGFTTSGTPGHEDPTVITEQFDLLVHIERTTRAHSIVADTPLRRRIRKPD